MGVGASHVLFLSEDDNMVYACGANSEGQLGVGDEEVKNKVTMCQMDEVDQSDEINIEKIMCVGRFTYLKMSN